MSDKPSSRITNHPSRTFTVTSGHIFMHLQLISLQIVDPHKNHSLFSVSQPITIVSNFTALEPWCGKFSLRIDSFDILNPSREFSPWSEFLRSPSTVHIRLQRYRLLLILHDSGDRVSRSGSAFLSLVRRNL